MKRRGSQCIHKLLMACKKKEAIEGIREREVEVLVRRRKWNWMCVYVCVVWWNLYSRISRIYYCHTNMAHFDLIWFIFSFYLIDWSCAALLRKLRGICIVHKIEIISFARRHTQHTHTHTHTYCALHRHWSAPPKWIHSRHKSTLVYSDLV